MKKAYISVNRQIVSRNSRTGSKEPPIAIRIGKSGKSGKPWYAKNVQISGPCEFIYDPEKPLLKCGARLIVVAREDHVTWSR